MNTHAPTLLVVLVVVLSVCALAEPPASQGQSPAPPRRIAILISDSPLSPTCTSDPPHVGVRALLEGLHALGYRTGENIAVECRSAGGKYNRLDALATELVQRNPAVLVATGAPASLAAKRTTSRIPVISLYTANPVALGLVASLARPGGNVTGISALASDTAAKSLQILREAAPRISRAGVLGHEANNTYAMYRQQLEPAGRALGIALDFEPVNRPEDIAAALSAMQRRGADAFFVMNQPFTYAQRTRIVAVVAQLQVPAMYGWEEAVEVGGLISYAASIRDVFHRAAYFVDRVLRGTKPADLPVEQPTVFRLAINLTTARSLGLAISPSLLLRVDRAID